MKKHFSIVSITLAGALLLASCQGTKEGDEPTPSDQKTLTFTSSLQSMSRATETEFETGDAISLFAVKGEEGATEIVLQPSGNHFHNLKFVWDGAQFTSNPVVYKADSDRLAIFAVYPYSETVGPEFSFGVKADQSTNEAYTASDLCTSTTGYSTEAQPNLTFYHRMSNLVVTLEGNTLGNGEVSVEFVNVATEVDVNLNNVSVERKDVLGDVKANPYGTNTWRAILAPQTIPGGTNFLRVTIGAKSYDLSFGSALNLGSGRQINIRVSVVNEVPAIISGDIYPWNTGADISYVIPEDVLDNIDDYITINHGVNPPNIEGCYLVSPFETVYCSDYPDNGGYEPGFVIADYYTLFSDQDMEARTIHFNQLSSTANHSSEGNGAFIQGEGNDFTVYLSTEGTSSEIYVKEAIVISGTKTSDGIANLQYAFVLLEKGDDPDNTLMSTGDFRVFRDQDLLSGNTQWPAQAQASRVQGLHNIFDSELLLRK